MSTDHQRSWIPENAIPAGGLLFSTPRLTAQYLASNKLNADFPRRFRAKVQRTEGGCWLWMGTKVDGAYGQIARGKPFAGMVLAHVASWILHRGPVPAGLCVLHNCPGGDCPACVNPAHLWRGTHVQNMCDKVAKGRTTAGLRGVSHKLSPQLVMQIGDLAAHRIFPQRQIASSYGISKERVKQIRREARPTPVETK